MLTAHAEARRPQAVAYSNYTRVAAEAASSPLRWRHGWGEQPTSTRLPHCFVSDLAAHRFCLIQIHLSAHLLK